MAEPTQISQFQYAIETVEALSLEEQNALLALLQRRLSQQRRNHLAEEIAEVRQDVSEGKVHYGSVEDFLAEVD